MALIRRITCSLDFAKNYQDMGMQPPRWQNVSQTFLFAISHLDFLSITHTLDVGSLEVYADPLFEKVFYNLMENVIRHGTGSSAVRLWYRKKTDGLVLFVEDNGIGIPQEEKQMIFDRGYGKETGLGLFLVREILSITGMSIKESGMYGQGACFEIFIPRGAYRFAGPA
ncbi:MAG TPA: HAMP domain-containing sensor histidine kinase [Methanoregula sp.]|nr:HAMP domain-containing sensor histidine kinase [Methanoregula sp.]